LTNAPSSAARLSRKVSGSIEAADNAPYANHRAALGVSNNPKRDNSAGTPGQDSVLGVFENMRFWDATWWPPLPSIARFA